MGQSNSSLKHTHKLVCKEYLQYDEIFYSFKIPGRLDLYVSIFNNTLHLLTSQRQVLHKVKVKCPIKMGMTHPQSKSLSLIETNQFLTYIYHNGDIVFQVINDVVKLDIGGITKIDEIANLQPSVPQIYDCVTSVGGKLFFSNLYNLYSEGQKVKSMEVAGVYPNLFSFCGVNFVKRDFAIMRLNDDLTETEFVPVHGSQTWIAFSGAGCSVYHDKQVEMITIVDLVLRKTATTTDKRFSDAEIAKVLVLGECGYGLPDSVLEEVFGKEHVVKRGEVWREFQKKHEKNPVFKYWQNVGFGCWDAAIQLLNEGWKTRLPLSRQWAESKSKNTANMKSIGHLTKVLEFDFKLEFGHQ